MNRRELCYSKVKNWNESLLDSSQSALAWSLISVTVTHLYSGLNVDGCDLLDNLGWTVEINHSLVDPHLELVPGLGTLSARSLPGGDSQDLGGHPDWSLDLELLVLGSSDEVTAHLLQRLDIPGGQSDSDAVDWHILLNSLSILR